jgi:hypothetical protein
MGTEEQSNSKRTMCGVGKVLLRMDRVRLAVGLSRSNGRLASRQQELKCGCMLLKGRMLGLQGGARHGLVSSPSAKERGLGDKIFGMGLSVRPECRPAFV